MALNAWQKITRVLPGKPFGDGSDGALTISASATQSVVDETCTGTATETALTAGGSSLTNGDVILIHQTNGTGAGQWEINKVASGGGSVNLVMSQVLKYSYATGAQVVKIPLYEDVTINASQIWSGVSWSAATLLGGILLFACNGTLTVSGTLNVKGNNGSHQSLTGYTGFTNGIGHRGGASIVGSGTPTAYQGAGTSGVGSASGDANGTGGGGGHESDSGFGSGGGGGHAAVGEAGSEGNGGTGGTVGGNAGLTNMVFGGGGGGTARADANPDDVGIGGAGGGTIFIFAKTITAPNLMTAAGGNGGVGRDDRSDAASGAGGSILLCGGIINIGTNKLTTIPGTVNSGYPGVGSKGRIAVYYGTSLAGSLSSTYYGTYTSAQDTDLVQTTDGGAFLLNFI